ncbi:hypothetical protein KJ762_16025 [bacterium]|nr:hypothetical protein [bacterium]MBU1635992.1 hypothetical protein [bacterium]MBU1875363.1 hypothetical protein [bacterium]
MWSWIPTVRKTDDPPDSIGTLSAITVMNNRDMFDISIVNVELDGIEPTTS